jgi:hypothetical protein
MTDIPRRRFLKGSAGVVSGLAIGACAQDVPPVAADAPVVDRAVLEALARIVLPRTSLGDAGVLRVTDDFLDWLEGFAPVAELDHPYYASDIRYGPPDPAPLWGAQLEALNLEAQQRHDTGFPQLAEDLQTAILDRQLPAEIPQDLPFAGNATHVAIGLNAYFYATAEANDLALRAQIHRQSCRGLESGPDKPAPLGD